MIYNWTRESCLASINPGPGRLFDANGDEILGPVCHADLENGLVTMYVQDGQGAFVLTPERNEVVTKMVQCLPPLKFIPRPKEPANELV